MQQTAFAALRVAGAREQPGGGGGVLRGLNAINTHFQSVFRWLFLHAFLLSVTKVNTLKAFLTLQLWIIKYCPLARLFGRTRLLKGITLKVRLEKGWWQSRNKSHCWLANWLLPSVFLEEGYFALRLLHFLPVLSSAGKQISKSPRVSQQDTGSASSSTLYECLLCNAALRHRLVVFVLLLFEPLF